jgi:hypothetical protein
MTQNASRDHIISHSTAEELNLLRVSRSLTVPMDSQVSCIS